MSWTIQLWNKHIGNHFSLWFQKWSWIFSAIHISDLSLMDWSQYATRISTAFDGAHQLFHIVNSGMDENLRMRNTAIARYNMNMLYFSGCLITALMHSVITLLSPCVTSRKSKFINLHTAVFTQSECSTIVTDSFVSPLTVSSMLIHVSFQKVVAEVSH